MSGSSERENRLCRRVSSSDQGTRHVGIGQGGREFVVLASLALPGKSVGKSI